MTVDEIKAAIEAERPSLREAFLKYAEEKGIEITTPRYAESWRAWEWCRRQFKMRGLTDDEVKEACSRIIAKMASGEAQDLGKADPYEMVRECLFGPA